MPSILSDLAFARRAVIASKLGMFLYPATIFRFSLSFSCLSVLSVSWLSSFKFSCVSGSPGSPTGVVVLLRGGDVDRPAGDVDRVLGGLTATESVFVFVLASDVCDPVRRRAAASRGRDATFAGLTLLGLRLMRAASWLSEGMRGPVDGLSSLACSTAGGAVSLVVAIVVDVVDQRSRSRSQLERPLTSSHSAPISRHTSLGNRLTWWRFGDHDIIWCCTIPSNRRSRYIRGDHRLICH